MNKSIDRLDEIVESWINGNISWAMTEIKKLSRNDRARIVFRFKNIVGSRIAFEIAEKVIKNEY